MKIIGRAILVSALIASITSIVLPVSFAAKNKDTVTTMTGTPNPSVMGSAVTLAATVTAPTGGTPTGTVAFTSNGSPIGTSCTLDGNGSCSISYTWAARGQYSVVATYTPTGNFNASASVASTQVVTRRTSSTVVVTSKPFAYIGDPLVFTTTVTGSGPTPTGTIILYAYESNTVIGTCTLASGSCVINLTASTVGNHRVWASYSGDDVEYLASNSPYIYQNNTAKPIPTIVVTTNPSPSNFGEAVTIRATASGSNGIPSGAVRFENGEGTIDGCTLDAAGTCAITVSTLKVGDHAIVAELLESASYQGAEGTVSHTVNAVAIATTTQVSTSANPAFTNTPFQVHAVVTSAGGNPTGVVDVLDGSTLLGSCTLVAGSTSSACSYTATLTTTGDHTINVQYKGATGVYLASSTSFTQPVTAPGSRSTVLTLVPSVESATVGSTVTFTATVTNSTTPTGTVTFSDNGTSFGSCTLSSGQCAQSRTFATASQHVIVATFIGNANFDTSTSTIGFEVSKRASVMTIVADRNPAPRLTTVHFDITLHPSATGSIWIEDGEKQTLGCESLTNGHCVASLSFATLGLHTLQFEYNGDALNSSAIQDFPITIGLSVPTVTISSDKATAEYYENINFTATLSDPAATGKISFFADGEGMRDCQLVAGTCTDFYYRLSVGTHSITAVYSGDTSTAGATSAAISQIVIPAHTSTTITSSASPFEYGAGLALVATVSSPGVGATGSIQFEDVSGEHEVILGTCNLVGTACTLVLSSPLSVGNHKLIAEYISDGNYSGSKSAEYTQVISAPTSAITIVSSSATSKLGETVTVTVNVNANGSTATGTVQILDGSSPVGSALTLVNGSASLAISTFTAGTHSLSATYSGDSNHAAGTSSAISQVVRNTVIVALAIDPLTLAFADTTRVTATVTSVGGTPKGDIVIEEELADHSDLVLGTCALVSGQCTYALSTLSVGTHTIYIEYGGATGYSSGASSKVVVTVTPRPVQSTPAPIQKVEAPTPPKAELSKDKEIATVVTSTTAGVVEFSATDSAGRKTAVGITVPAGAIEGTGTLTVKLVSSPTDNGKGFVALEIKLISSGNTPALLAKPLELKISPQGTTGKPATSSDGINWFAISKVTSGSLSTGALSGYFLDANRNINVLTLKTSVFDLLKPQNVLSVKTFATHLQVGQHVTLASRGGAGNGALTYSSNSPAVCSVTAAGELVGLTVGDCSVSVAKGSDSNYLNAVSAPKVFAVRP